MATIATPIEDLPVKGLLQVKRAPIAEEKKSELAITTSQLKEEPTVAEIQRVSSGFINYHVT